MKTYESEPPYDSRRSSYTNKWQKEKNRKTVLFKLEAHHSIILHVLNYLISFWLWLVHIQECTQLHNDDARNDASFKILGLKSKMKICYGLIVHWRVAKNNLKIIDPSIVFDAFLYKRIIYFIQTPYGILKRKFGVTKTI